MLVNGINNSYFSSLLEGKWDLKLDITVCFHSCRKMPLIGPDWPMVNLLFLPDSPPLAERILKPCDLFLSSLIHILAWAMDYLCLIPALPVMLSSQHLANLHSSLLLLLPMLNAVLAWPFCWITAGPSRIFSYRVGCRGTSPCNPWATHYLVACACWCRECKSKI